MKEFWQFLEGYTIRVQEYVQMKYVRFIVRFTPAVTGHIVPLLSVNRTSRGNLGVKLGTTFGTILAFVSAAMTVVTLLSCAYTIGRTAKGKVIRDLRILIFSKKKVNFLKG